jgi:hypothetical protein
MENCRTLGEPSLINARQSAVFMRSLLVKLKRKSLHLVGAYLHSSSFEMH